MKGNRRCGKGLLSSLVWEPRLPRMCNDGLASRTNNARPPSTRCLGLLCNLSAILPDPTDAQRWAILWHISCISSYAFPIILITYAANARSNQHRGYFSTARTGASMALYTHMWVQCRQARPAPPTTEATLIWCLGPWTQGIARTGPI